MREADGVGGAPQAPRNTGVPPEIAAKFPIFKYDSATFAEGLRAARAASALAPTPAAQSTGPGTINTTGAADLSPLPAHAGQTTPRMTAASDSATPSPESSPGLEFGNSLKGALSVDAHARPEYFAPASTETRQQPQQVNDTPSVHFPGVAGDAGGHSPPCLTGPLSSDGGGGQAGDSDSEDDPDNPQCSVCICDFEEGEVLRRLLPCNHVFHQACIDQWMAQHSTCPNCRTALWDGASNTTGGRRPR